MAREGQVVLECGTRLWRAGDRQASFYLVGGSGSYEIAHLASGRAPRAQTRSIELSPSKNLGSEESKRQVAIHHCKLREEKCAFVSIKAPDGMRQFPVAPLQP